MGKLKVGAFLNSFATDFKNACAMAHNLGLDVVEFASMDEYDLFSPLSDDKIKVINEEFAKNEISFSSLCAEVGGFAIADAEECKKRVEAVKQVIDNAVRLGVKIIQFHIGELKFEEGDARFIENQNAEVSAQGDPGKNLVDALKDLDAYAGKAGVRLATETGPEPGDKLAAFIKDNGFENVFVNFDPANLVMNGFDEIKSVYDLKGLVIQTHAKDGIFGSVKDGYKETALGEGDVHWEEYLKALVETGFEGNFIIEREVGDTPADDIAMAAKFLKNW
ncbi:MAG: sugar phosphate isomerase/epimerase [Armatimonadetes bacterium]|nr:sugar phosphate isomerase/epimerase [Candidatus Hippobium faecium]